MNKQKVDFDSSQTKINLARAFAGECQDGARYQFMADQAKQEGYEYIQQLLKTIAKNEMAHAKRYFTLINKHCKGDLSNITISGGGYPFKCGGLQMNLAEAMEVEYSQYDNVYPSFGEVAKDEGYDEVAKSFEFIASVEHCHNMLLKQLSQKMKAGKLYTSPTPIKWKCSNCGFEHTAKTPWEQCPLCQMPQGYVEIPIDVQKDSE